MKRPVLVLVTTPRSNSLAGILGFLRYGRAFRHGIWNIVLVLAMPSPTRENVRKQILAMLQPGEFLRDMSPEADGCGSIFRFALSQAFYLIPDAKAVLHVPIDIAWGEIHPKDIQLGIAKMVPHLEGDSPVLVLGDYDPMLWKDGAAERHLTKSLIGDFVRRQLAHYGFAGKFHNSGLQQVRTEVFGTNSRALVESAVCAGAFQPFDPIPFVALHAWKNGFPVDAVHLGTFYEDANPEPSRVRGQVIRVAHQMASAFLAEQEVTGMADAAAQTERWKRIVLQGMEQAFDDLSDILRKLQEAEEKKAKGTHGT